MGLVYFHLLIEDLQRGAFHPGSPSVVVLPSPSPGGSRPPKSKSGVSLVSGRTIHDGHFSFAVTISLLSVDSLPPCLLESHVEPEKRKQPAAREEKETCSDMVPGYKPQVAVFVQPVDHLHP